MSFAWPLLFAALPLFWLVSRFRKPATDNGIEHPYLASLADQETSNSNTKKHSLWLHLAWLFLVLALARPQWLGDPVMPTQAGRSLYLSVDLSASMLEQDMSWNGRAIERYQAVQAVVGEFVSERKNDFIGLVVFGSFAEIQAPLTPDTQAIQAMLNDLRPGMAGDSTAIGDGLALAVKQLRDSDSPDKVIILLSDGENTTGSVTPDQAMEIALQSGIKVYTIGFGSNGQGGRLSLFNTRSRIDEGTLKEIAEQTDGQYFRAASTDDLINVFDTIDELETDNIEGDQRRQINELYSWPLLASFALFCAPLIASTVTSWRQRNVS